MITIKQVIVPLNNGSQLATNKDEEKLGNPSRSSEINQLMEFQLEFH
nr:MAG TPA: hypothetical protein [Caudoviricetes sp.]